MLRTTIVAVVLTILTVVPHAQDRPDFSGRWTLMPELSVIQGRDGHALAFPSHFFIISAMLIEETGVMDDVHVIIPGSRNFTMLL